MPVGYAVDQERRLVFMRAWGALTNASLQLQAEALHMDSAVDPAFGLLLDLRGVAAHRVTLGLIQRFPTSFSRLARRAIVVGDVYGLAMAQAYSGLVAAGGSTLVTRDFEEALEWLGLPSGTRLPDRLSVTFEAAES